LCSVFGGFRVIGHAEEVSILNEKMLVKNEILTGASIFIFFKMATVIFVNFSHDRYKQLSIIGFL
jgi:hypothetical protein